MIKLIDILKEIKIIPPTIYVLNPMYEKYVDPSHPEYDIPYHEEIAEAEGEEVADAVIMFSEMSSDKHIQFKDMEKYVNESDMWDSTAEELLEFFLDYEIITKK